MLGVFFFLLLLAPDLQQTKELFTHLHHLLLLSTIPSHRPGPVRLSFEPFAEVIRRYQGCDDSGLAQQFGPTERTLKLPKDNGCVLQLLKTVLQAPAAVLQQVAP
jgi:hypothetical protein